MIIKYYIVEQIYSINFFYKFILDQIFYYITNMPNDLKFDVVFRVPTYIMYETLTNPTELTKFTQSQAKFDKTIGGEFDLYNGYITGTNEELSENKKIVQKCKF